MPPDLRRARRASAVAWERLVRRRGGSRARAELAESWRISEPSLNPESHGAQVDEAQATRDEWRDSPLCGPTGRLCAELDRITADGYIVAVTNAAGKILHTEGSGWMRSRAEQVNVVSAARRHEASMAADATAPALRRGGPETVFSTEHFSGAVHDWVCYSAPIVDPDSGSPLGVVDLSTTWDRAHPFALTVAATLARCIGEGVGRARPVIAGPKLDLHTLGAAAVRVDGRAIHLAPRQVEILAVLALHPEGMSLDHLHAAVYSDASCVSRSTCKAEVSHLRSRLPGVIASRPYRLACSLVADHVEVERLLRAGRLAEAAQLYRGTMLETSDAPAVVEQRNYLEVSLQSVARRSHDAGVLLSLSDSHPEDPAIQARCLELLPADDALAPLVAGRLHRAG